MCEERTIKWNQTMMMLRYSKEGDDHRPTSRAHSSDGRTVTGTPSFHPSVRNTPPPSRGEVDDGWWVDANTMDGGTVLV